MEQNTNSRIEGEFTKFIDKENLKDKQELHEITEKHGSIRVAIIMSGLLVIVILVAGTAFAFWRYRNKSMRSDAEEPRQTRRRHGSMVNGSMVNMVNDSMVELEVRKPKQKRKPNKQSSDEDEMEEVLEVKKVLKKGNTKPKILLSFDEEEIKEQISSKKRAPKKYKLS